jgi:hypothetical protein
MLATMARSYLATTSLPGNLWVKVCKHHLRKIKALQYGISAVVNRGDDTMFDAILHTPLFQALLFLNIASAGLVTGGAMVMAAAYTPLLAGLPQRETIMIHEGMGRYIDRYQPKMAWLALATGLLELSLSTHLWQTICILLGVAGISGLIIISKTSSIPLAKKIVAWTPAAAKSLEQLKTRWIHVHYIRSTCGLLGFLFFIIATLLLVLH